MPLGDTFKPAHFGDTCNTAGTFILTTFTYPHAHRALAATAFPRLIRLDPYIQCFVSAFSPHILTIGIL